MSKTANKFANWELEWMELYEKTLQKHVRRGRKYLNKIETAGEYDYEAEEDVAQLEAEYALLKYAKRDRRRQNAR